MISDSFTSKYIVEDRDTVGMNILPRYNYALYMVHKLTGSTKLGTFQCA